MPENKLKEVQAACSATLTVTIDSCCSAGIIPHTGTADSFDLRHSRDEEITAQRVK